MRRYGQCYGALLPRGKKDFCTVRYRRAEGWTGPFRALITMEQVAMGVSHWQGAGGQSIVDGGARQSARDAMVRAELVPVDRTLRACLLMPGPWCLMLDEEGGVEGRQTLAPPGIDTLVGQ